MLKRTIAMPLVIILGISLVPGALGASLADSAPVDPVALAPAATDVFVEFNNSGAQGDALAKIASTYRSHPGTAAAIERVRARLGASGVAKFETLVGMVGDRIGMAVIAPATPAGGALSTGGGLSPLHGVMGSSATEVAFMTQLKPVGLAGGVNPFSSLGTFTPALTYRGTTIYKVLFQGSMTPGYATIVSGVGVLAMTQGTVQRIIDTANGAPSLASQPDYRATMAQVPGDHTLTAYVSKGLLERYYASALASASTPAARGQLVQLARYVTRSYAVTITSYQDGFGVLSSLVPGVSATTPNRGRNLVGDNAIVYASFSNLAGILRGYHVVNPSVIRQYSALSGINIETDILPLLSREIVVDVNDESSPLLAGLEASSGTSGARSGPGSIELATEVASSGQAYTSLTRLLAALTRGSAAGRGQIVRQIRLPDGSVGYAVPALPSVGFTFRQSGGHPFLVFSTNLAGDVRIASHPLGKNADYISALAHVTGTGAVTNVQYVSISRLLDLIGKVVTSQSRYSTIGDSSGLATYRNEVEPLLAPLHSLASVTRQVNLLNNQSQAFLAIH